MAEAVARLTRPSGVPAKGQVRPPPRANGEIRRHAAEGRACVRVTGPTDRRAGPRATSRRRAMTRDATKSAACVRARTPSKRRAKTSPTARAQPCGQPGRRFSRPSGVPAKGHVRALRCANGEIRRHAVEGSRLRRWLARPSGVPAPWATCATPARKKSNAGTIFLDGVWWPSRDVGEVGGFLGVYRMAKTNAASIRR